MASTGRSRTVRTLAALVAAMSIGAFVLILMETEPARPTAPLQADGKDEKDAEPNPADRTATVRRTDVPIQPIKWRNIVVHDAAGRGRLEDGNPDGCHFLIGGPESFGDGAVRSTHLWRQQLDGNHLLASGHPCRNEDSIGIRLLCDTGRTAPSSNQMAALTDLARALQVICRIPSDRVYLYSELSGPDGPGRLFPAETFRGRLITARRQ